LINTDKLEEGQSYVIEPGMVPGITEPEKRRAIKNKDTGKIDLVRVK
jgi:hypothetical protein